MAQDRYKYFRIEARELVDELGKGVLALEKEGSDAELVARLLRLAHTLKGAARVVKQGAIADLAHAVEDAIAPMRDDRAALPHEAASAVLELLDRVTVHLGALAAPEPPPASDTRDQPTQAPDEPLPLARSDDDELDGLVEGVNEARFHVAAFERAVDAVERSRHVIDLLRSELASPRGLRHDRSAPKALALVDELSSLATGLGRQLAVAVEGIDRELGQVREAAQRIRLSPVGSMFTALERTARDAALSLGKRVTVVCRGSEVRLDAQVLAIVQRALLQAVRNAVAHGIEPPAEREANGKDPEGQVLVAVLRRGDRVTFRCSDDGRGVDLNAVRAAAERRGLLRDAAARLDAQGLTRLLLGGGISTAPVVTGVAGRGVGLDVVREAATQLGGEVHIATRGNAGTTLEMVVPVSLTSLEALVVEAGGQTAAIPLDAVRRSLRLTPSDVAESADGASIVYEGNVIPFLPLARSLTPGLRDNSQRRAWSAVVVSGERSLAAVGVDRLRGAENVVWRSLPPLAMADPIVMGASLDARGDPQMVLDPERLVAAAGRPRATRPEAPPRRAPILVIDDSLTTRMLEQTILESAGYDVEVAASAEEAFDKATKADFGLFLVDVEMPGMDGFTFIERSRADVRMRGVPAILVTSRAAPEDQARGKAVGASAYIVKSEFDQRELVALIDRLVS
jgi:two-component system chemotaxis sensor kinase CheA